METDIGNPIDYDPTMDPLNKNEEKHEDSTPINDHMIQDQSYYPHPSEMMYPPQQFQQPETNDFLWEKLMSQYKSEFFADIQQGGADRIASKFCSTHDATSTYQFASC